MSGHNNVGNMCGADLPASKPAVVQTFDGLFRRVNAIELNIYFTLRAKVNVIVVFFTGKRTSESLSTLIWRTFPYFCSHSPLTSSARSLSQFGSVSMLLESATVFSIVDVIHCHSLVRVEHVTQKDILRRHTLSDHRPSSKKS